jgi:hypothetical protein
MTKNHEVQLRGPFSIFPKVTDIITDFKYATLLCGSEIFSLFQVLEEAII